MTTTAVVKEAFRPQSLTNSAARKGFDLLPLFSGDENVPSVPFRYSDF